MNLTLLAAVEPSASSGRLVPAALAGIALIVVLITVLKVHPFLSLTLGSLLVGVLAGLPTAEAITSFGDGFGSTAAGVGVLIALGAMFGKLLADSGGSDQIVETIISRAGGASLPWAMALVGALIGLPMFFEIGLVLLMPVIYLVARRSGLSLIQVGVPALASLSVMHGLVPPHPGPLVAIDALGADLGRTLGLGVLIALPTIAVSGPLFARYAARWVNVPAPGSPASGGLAEPVPALAGGRPAEAAEHGTEGAAAGTKATAAVEGPGAITAGADERPAMHHRPSFPLTLATVLLPVALMMGKALADIALDETSAVRGVLDNLGTPLVALLIAVVVAMLTLTPGAGMDRQAVTASVQQALPPIAGILLIVAAGGGFKQTLVNTGIGDLVADWVTGSGLPVLLLAWLVAVLIRLATGSATVATVTAAGILAPVVTTLSANETSLLALAIGAGSLFFSHVNDAGFWLVKEYFGLSVGENLKTWSVMETIISVCGLLIVLVLSIVL